MKTAEEKEWIEFCHFEDDMKRKCRKGFLAGFDCAIEMLRSEEAKCQMRNEPEDSIQPETWAAWLESHKQ